MGPIQTTCLPKRERRYSENKKMSDTPTIDEIRDILSAAGYKIRSNTSEETIRKKYAEYLAKADAPAKTEKVEDAKAEPEPVVESPVGDKNALEAEAVAFYPKPKRGTYADLQRVVKLRRAFVANGGPPEEK